MVKAVVVDEPNGVPHVRDLELPPVGENDVRVRIAAAGVCHSDLSMINGTLTPQFPLVLGHEAAGVVAEVGSAVSGLDVGTHVALDWATPCRTCWFCTNDQPWLCTAVEGAVAPDTGYRDGEQTVYSCMGVGAFSEEVVVPAASAIPIPDAVPLDVAALLGCAVLTGVGAVRNTAQVRAGESVLVIGLGGIGLAAVLGAKAAGASRIIAVDVNEDKSHLALRAGATDFLVSEPKLAKQVRALTDGRGADHAFECVGNSATIRMAWGSVRRGGQCTIVGVGNKDQEVTFNPLELFHFSRTLTSSIYGASDPDRDVPVLAGQFLSGRLGLDLLITHRIGLADVAEAFDRMRSGEGVRSVVELGDR